MQPKEECTSEVDLGLDFGPVDGLIAAIASMPGAVAGPYLLNPHTRKCPVGDLGQDQAEDLSVRTETVLHIQAFGDVRAGKPKSPGS